MSVPYLAGSATAASGTSLVVTAGSNGGAGAATGVAAHDAILACASNGGGSGVTGVTDSASGAYTAGPATVTVPGSAIWSALHSAGLVSGTGTATVTWSGSTGAKNAVLIGVPGATGMDSAAATTAAGTVAGGSLGTPSAGSLTTGTLAEAGEAVIAVLTYGATGGTAISWGAGWTQLGAPFRTSGSEYTAVAYAIPGTTSPVTLSVTGLAGTPAWTAAIAAVRHTVSAAQTVTPAQAAALAQTEVTAAAQAVTPAQAGAIVLSPAKISAAQAVTPAQSASLLVTGPGQFPKAPLGVKVELNLGGTWTDATAYAYAPAGEPVVRITRGRPDQSPGARPQSATLQASNADGRWTFSNPSSPWYGQLTRNTPVRVSVPASQAALRLEDDTASFASCPDATGLHVSGAVDIRVDLALTSYMPGVLAAKWTPGGLSNSWLLFLNGDGTLTLSWSTSGSDNPSATSTLPVPLGRCAVRATFNGATGAAKFYVAASMNAPFSQLGNTVQGVAVSIFAGTAPVGVGDYGSTGAASGTPGPTGGITFTADASPPYASTQAAIAGWNSQTGRTSGCLKVYFAKPGSSLISMYPYYNTGYVAGQNDFIDACLSLRIVPICCYKPPIPYTAGDSANMIASMKVITTIFAAIGITPIFILWQEIQDKKNAISAAAYTSVTTGQPKYYTDIKAATSPAITGPIYYDAAGHAGPSGWNAYYPGDAYVDGVGVDLYASDWNEGAITLDVIAALADNHGPGPVPFAIFEMGQTVNVGQLPTQQLVKDFFTYIEHFMGPAGRLGAGKANGPVMWYNGGPPANWNTIAPLNSSGVNAAGYNNAWIIPLWQQLADTLAGLGAAPSAAGVNGRIYEFSLRNGIGISGTVVADPQFYGQPPGTQTFADAEGNTWSLHGTAQIDQRSYRFHGEVSAPALGTDPAQTDLTVAVACGGILRRLQQGNAPVASPMRRAILAQAGTLVPRAYWPMEDLAGATVFGSATGGPAMTITGTPALASDSTFACSAPGPVMNGAILAGPVASYTSSGSLIVRFLLNVQGTEPPNLARLMRVITSGSCTEFSLYYGTGGSLGLGGYNASGTVFDSGLVAFGVHNNPVWVSMELRPAAGFTVNWSFVTLQPGAATGLGFSGTFTGTIGNAIYVYPDPQGALGQVTISHVQVQSDWTSLFSLFQPLNAWTGETAGRRFARLCGENGVQARIYGYPDVSAAMGAQAVDALPNLLAQCETADRGQIFESRHSRALAYRTLVAMLNQPPVTLDFSAGHLDYSNWQPPVFDDLYFVNDVSVTRQTGAAGASSGATYRAYLNDGSASSISPPPAGAGDYATSLSVPVAADAQLGDIAGWAVHAGTAGGARYPAIPVDLAWPVMATLLPALQGVDIGDYLQVVNPRPWLQADPVRQLAAGAIEELGDFVYRLTWNGVPEVPYETGLLDDPVYGHADTDGSTLDALTGTTDLTINVDPVNPAQPLWTTNPADFPFDLNCGGERVTVTDINGPPANFLTGDDAGFDASAGDWVAAGNCAIARSTAQAHSGTASLALTSTAAGNMTAASFPAASITTLGLPVSPGDSISVAASFLAATAGETVRVGAGFYDVNGTFLSVVFATPNGADATTGWAKVTGSVTAPASAAFARMSVQVAAAAGGEVHYVDDCYIGDATGAPVTQTFTVTRSVNGVVASHNQGTDVRLFYPLVLAIA